MCCVQRLHSGADGTMVPSGFTESSDASADDISLWMPSSHADHHTMNTDDATYLVNIISDEFCKIVEEERQAVLWWNKLDSRDFVLFITVNDLIGIF